MRLQKEKFGLAVVNYAADNNRPCSHCQFYPTRVPFANSTRSVVRVHTASTASGSSSTRRPHRAGRCPVRQRRTVFSCLQTDLFLSTLYTQLICSAANCERKHHNKATLFRCQLKLTVFSTTDCRHRRKTT